MATVTVASYGAEHRRRGVKAVADGVGGHDDSETADRRHWDGAGGGRSGESFRAIVRLRTRFARPRSMTMPSLAHLEGAARRAYRQPRVRHRIVCVMPSGVEADADAIVAVLSESVLAER